MTDWLIPLLSLVYLLGLFLIARKAEKSNSPLYSNSVTYALGMMVYCTAWTFYGSIGRAAENGLQYLAIYIGPLLIIPFLGIILRKTVRICRTMRISSLADFLAVRYGKNARIGLIATLISLVSIIPYIALQIKALEQSLYVISGTRSPYSAFLITVFLIPMALLFGARNVDTHQRRQGLVSAIAVESLVKLLAFLIGAGFIVFVLYSGVSGAFEDISVREYPKWFSMRGSYLDWFLLSLVSAVAFILLPRQFQMGSVDVGNEKHINGVLKYAPLYLLLINLLVLPVAALGVQNQPGANADFYLLSLVADFPLIAGLIYLGGFSAATGMILISTTALSTMASNYLIIPAILRKDRDEARSVQNYHTLLLKWRRMVIASLLLIAFGYYIVFTEQESLVSIGIISFVGIAQLAPAFFGGLFWKKGHRRAAGQSILAGFIIWLVFLVVPNIATHYQHFEPAYINLMKNSLEPRISILGFSIMFSLTTGTAVYILQSYRYSHSAGELNQATLFVDIFRYENRFDHSVAWKGTATFPDIKSLLVNFIGKERAEAVLNRYARHHGIDWDANPQVDARVVSYAERVLTGIIGPSSARIMVESVVHEEQIGMDEVIHILEESREVILLNRQLSQKKAQLEKAGQQLKHANLALKDHSRQKDEFLNTVTHELRTPVTAMRSLAEVIQEDQEMPAEDRQHFVSQIIAEAERVSHLITKVLDLEKFENGQKQLESAKTDLNKLLHEETTRLQPLFDHDGVQLQISLHNQLPSAWCDETRVRQVVNNLLSNALKYCHPDKGFVEVSAHPTGEFIKINFANNGPIIPAEERPKLFDKFYQVKKKSNNKPLGHGLGLAICKRIVDMHGGEIGIDERRGLTRFYFTLPAYKEKMII